MWIEMEACMSTLYQTKLKKLAEAVNIAPADLHDILIGNVPFIKYVTYQRDRIYEKVAAEVRREGNGIFYTIIHKTDQSSHFILPSGDYIRRVHDGIIETVSTFGYNTTFYISNMDLADEAYFEAIFEKYHDFGIVYFSAYGIETVAKVADRHHVAVVGLEVLRTSQPLYTIDIDNHEAMQSMTRHLIELGHRRIAFIAGVKDHRTSEERLAGYRHALDDAGIVYQQEYVKHGNWHSEQAEQLTYELLDLDPRPTAIVCINDNTAMGVYVACHERGLIIPQDISITGFDDLPLAQNCSPELTTVHQPLDVMTRHAGEVIVKMIEGQQLEQYHYVQKLEIVERGSIGPVKPNMF